MTAALPIKAVTILGPAAVLAQVSPVLVPLGSLEGIGKLGLVAALVIAIVWLANFLVKLLAANDVKIAALMESCDAKLAAKDVKIAEKDAQNMALTAELTKTMTEVLGAVREARIASNDTAAAMDNVAENLAALTGTINSREIEKAEKKDHDRRHGTRPAKVEHEK